MFGSKIYFAIRRFFGLLRRRASIVLIAIMLGMSNAILEEDRTLNDTRNYIAEYELPSNDGNQ